ncbi:hypothetical protein DENSPDRAFT_697832 [Dentipellis sp. KUC8613]|nr:hypothetical protein DENSPDRAFT_697832 [Dentipellis sp. KUC8613]
MAFVVRGFLFLSVALFFVLSFLPLPASAMPTANVASPAANWAIHRQGSHIPVLAGHGALAKRICYGDCRAVHVDANATAVTTPTSEPDVVDPPSEGAPAAEPPDPGPDPDSGGLAADVPEEEAGVGGASAGVAVSAEPATTLLFPSNAFASTPLPASSSPSVQPSASPPSVSPSPSPSPSSSESEDAQSRIGASTSGARASSSAALLPLILLASSTVLYVL